MVLEQLKAKQLIGQEKVFLKLLQKRLKKLQLPQPNTLATTKLLGLSIINLNFQINFL